VVTSVLLVVHGARLVQELRGGVFGEDASVCAKFLEELPANSGYSTSSQHLGLAAQ
jgi:hypothetical protein